MILEGCTQNLGKSASGGSKGPPTLNVARKGESRGPKSREALVGRVLMPEFMMGVNVEQAGQEVQ